MNDETDIEITRVNPLHPRYRVIREIKKWRNRNKPPTIDIQNLTETPYINVDTI